MVINPVHRPSVKTTTPTNGVYYLIRSVTIAPAAFIGGLLREVTPALPFWLAGVIESNEPGGRAAPDPRSTPCAPARQPRKHLP
jgi:hypothetical protein